MTTWYEVYEKDNQGNERRVAALTSHNAAKVWMREYIQTLKTILNSEHLPFLFIKKVG